VAGFCGNPGAMATADTRECSAPARSAAPGRTAAARRLHATRRLRATRAAVPVDDTLDRQEVRRRIVAGLAWESGTKLAMQLLGWIATVYVARTLGPEAYGIVAISGIYTMFVQIVAEAGVTSGLVTRTGLRDDEVRAVAWLNVYVAAALYAVLFATAPLLARLYGIPDLVDVLRVAGLGVFITAPRAVSMALVLRGLDYRFRATTEFAGQAAQSVTMLVLAWAGAGAWTLVWAYLVGQSLTTALFFRRAGRFGRPTFRLGRAREIVAFGGKLTLSRTANYAVGLADLVIVSWATGPRGAGLYMMAQTLASLPIDKVGAILNRVSFPAVARLQHDLPGIRRYFLAAHFWLVALCAPAAIGGALVAADLVQLLFADRWRDAGGILALLCVAAAFRLSGMMMPPVLEGLRHAGFLVRYSAASAALLIPAFLLGSRIDGARGVAAAWALLAPVLWAALAWNTLRWLGLGRREFLRSLLPVVTALGAMVIAVLFARRGLAEQEVGLRLGLEIATGAVVYAIVLAWLTPPSRRRQVRDAFVTLRARRGGGAPPTASSDATVDADRRPDVPVAAQRMAHRDERTQQ
jgi:teichuronic acid exporter